MKNVLKNISKFDIIYFIYYKLISLENFLNSNLLLQIN